jgi:hypothetical protein
MNATLQLRKSYILKGSLLASAFFAVVLVHIIVPLLPLDLTEEERIPLMVMAWGPCMVVYGGMFLMSVFILCAAIRSQVIIQGKQVTDVGVFRQRNFDLSQVTRAQWYARLPRLRVSTPAGWVPFDFRVHRTDEARQLIQFFRNGLAPEIQEGWTPAWKERAVAFDSTPMSQGKLPWSRLAVLGGIAGVANGLICGTMVYFLNVNLKVAPFSWSGSLFVDWAVYGFAAALGISIPATVGLVVERYCAWLDR